MAGCSQQAYLVQSGHEKQDEDEDVKGRDHHQEEGHGCGRSLGKGTSRDGRIRRLARRWGEGGEIPKSSWREGLVPDPGV